MADLRIFDFRFLILLVVGAPASSSSWWSLFFFSLLIAIAGRPLPPVVSFIVSFTCYLFSCSGDSGDNTVVIVVPNSNVNTCTRLFLDNVVRIHLRSLSYCM